MIHVLYNILLLPATLFVIPYHIYRSLSRGRRSALAERLGFIPPAKVALLAGEGAIWVHAVSVGETIAAIPLLKALKKKYPARKILFTNGTETGRGVAEKLAEVDCCFYFPFDYRFAVSRVLRLVRPSLVVIVETEIWPNFLHTARTMGIPVVLANGRISDRSFARYLKLRWFFRPVLENFSALCMQSDVDATRIIAMGAPADRVHVVRNLKYDIPAAPVAPAEQAVLRQDYRLPSEVPVVIAGSTHDGEEEIVLAAYLALLAEGRKLFLVLVPRHPERAEAVAELLRREGMNFSLRSQLDGRSASLAPGDVLLVDTVGELMKLYAMAAAVFVGGSLVPTGGHNVLEPASLGVPVLFGPHMGNFREIAALISNCGGGVQVGNGTELADTLRALLDDVARRAEMGRKGARLLEENSGSTQRHMAVLARFIGGN
jgi:3-deoxy-D-manno-octulosonic-acid transferase